MTTPIVIPATAMNDILCFEYSAHFQRLTLTVLKLVLNIQSLLSIFRVFPVTNFDGGECLTFYYIFAF